jgi:hypothetical protein
MKILTGTLLVIFIAGLIPQQYTYVKTGDPLQGYCAMAKADAKLLGETLNGNLKYICQ